MIRLACLGWTVAVAAALELEDDDDDFLSLQVPAFFVEVGLAVEDDVGVGAEPELLPLGPEPESEPELLEDDDAVPVTNWATAGPGKV